MRREIVSGPRRPSEVDSERANVRAEATLCVRTRRWERGHSPRGPGGAFRHRPRKIIPDAK